MTTPVVRGTGAAATLAFDRLAPEYDTLADGEIFRLLRRRTHSAFARRFTGGSRVLEIGCGTGLDTLFMASQGLHVVACDPSEEMVSRSLRRLAHEGVGERVTVLPCGLHDLASFLDALAEPGGFDGIVSNFGALNCVEHLAPLGALARRYLRSGGVMMLGLMGRVCAVEALYFTATRRVRLAGRRLGTGASLVPVAGVDVPTFYHRIADVRATLGPELVLEGIEGIGVALPPPYLEARWQQLPRAFRGILTRVDALLAPWPPFNRVGDHVLLQFAKRREPYRRDVPDRTNQETER
jgi:ubiquinone/menaquinone biosynthesis C-methylase UbiE